MRKNNTQTRSLLQKIRDSLDISDFLKPFFFVFETGYWGGLLTRTIAIYAIYLMFGMTLYGINIVTNQLFATLSGDSLTSFYYAAGFFITLNLSIRTLDSIGKMLSTQLERAQSKQGHNTFTKTEENHKNLQKKINRFTDEERAKKAEGLRRGNPTHTQCQIDKILSEEEAKLDDQCGFRIFDQVTVFSNINKISGQFLQSIASVIVNVHFMIKIGMGRACYTLLTGMVAVNIGIVYYTWRVMKPLDKKLANTKNTIINMWKSKPLPTSELEEKQNEYDTIYYLKISKDTMIDIFNNCIRYCALPLGIFIAVFSLAGGVFPVTSTILASGTPLTTSIIIATAAAIERIIQDTSIFAKNYKDLYQAGSNFENIDILMKRGGITARHRSMTYLGSPRNPSFFDHVMHHGFFAITTWAALAVATDLTGLWLGSNLPLIMLVPTLAVGIVAFIGMNNTNKSRKPDTYDYIINAVFAAILTITTLIVTSSDANLLTTVAQIAPSLAQKVHLGCGVGALFYTLSSACTHWLKPSPKQLVKVQQGCDAQVAANELVKVQEDNELVEANTCTVKPIESNSKKVQQGCDAQVAANKLVKVQEDNELVEADTYTVKPKESNSKKVQEDNELVEAGTCTVKPSESNSKSENANTRSKKKVEKGISRILNLYHSYCRQASSIQPKNNTNLTASGEQRVTLNARNIKTYEEYLSPINKMFKRSP